MERTGDSIVAAKTSTTRAPTKALSARERLFAHEYVRQRFNGTQAAIAAGYAENSARQTAARLLSKAALKAYIDRLSEKAIAKVDEKAQEVLDELRHMAMGRVSRCVRIEPDGSVKVKPLEEWTEDDKAALTDIDIEAIFEGRGDERTHVGNIVKLKMKAKHAALETLAKHHKLLVDRVEHEHSGTVYVVDPYGEAPAAPADTEE